MTQLQGYVEKGWGSELIWATTDKYCGKMLNFNDEAKFSMHFHMNKIETWYVSKGEFLLKYIDTQTAEHFEKKVGEGTIIEIGKGDPHQLFALTDGEIFEISTEHFDDDSYRIFKGDSQL